MIKRVCITGGGGFLGRYVVRLCLERGWEVVSYQRRALPDLEAMGVVCVRGDLTDAARLAEAMRGCDAVFHIAAKAGIWGRREDFWMANYTGTQSVLEAVRQNGIRYLVYTSTPSVIFSGEAFEGADETLPYGRNWLCHYAESKAAAEQLALSAHGEELKVCALRPHLIWGEGDPHLLLRVLHTARSGRLKMVGDGRSRVDITHVRNAADAHLLALEALQQGRTGGKAYFLSQGEPVVLWDWINQFLQKCGEPPLTKRVSAKAAYRVGAVLEVAWKLLRLKGEPPMTRFVAVELSKSHWFSIQVARDDLGYAPENYPTGAMLDDYVRSLKA